MLEQLKSGKFILIIKGGLFGIFALTDILVFLAIAYIFAGFEFINIDNVFKGSLSLVGFVVLICVTEFVFGVILARLFPFIVRGKIPLIIAFVLMVFPLGFVTWLFHKAAMEAEYPSQELKLADCTNNVVSFNFVVPRGHDHQLQLRSGTTHSSQGEGNIVSDVSVHLRISSDGLLLTNMPIGSDVLPLSKLIHPHTNYNIEIKFDSPPPTNTSVWVVWWKSKNDK